jgi:redox-sensitive bicupin YhaK (pirin superfamily)
MKPKTQRKVSFLTQGQAAMDGAGVRLTRIIGSQQLTMLDPFLLLDCFESDNPDDYIAGFPAHPHRGFETVTYLLAGRMRHQDSVGNEGVIEAGGVQWMTAGKGIIHSEMPEQQDGLLTGFQLWVNLPATEKMCAPNYQEFSPDKVTLEQGNNGSQVRIIAGKTNQGSLGPVVNEHISPTYLDVQLPAQQEFSQEINAEHNSFIYLIHGQIDIAGEIITAGTLAVLSKGEEVTIAAEQDSRFLLLAAKPLNEPVVRAGPFVMNSREQLMQAYDDFQNNNFLN